MIIGVDTGGTFTDLVCLVDRHLYTYKVPSTPDLFEEAILEGLQHFTRLLPDVDFDFIHSSTVATNALLENKIAKTSFIATKGFSDMVEIGRQERPKLYDLYPQKPASWAAASLRSEVLERVNVQGKIEKALTQAEIKRVVRFVKKTNCESVAICLLHAYLQPRHEKALQKALKASKVSVSLSSHILPEYREYERASTTLANACIAPLMEKYISGLAKEIKKRGAKNFYMVQSSGGMVSEKSIMERPIATVLSGPAAGVRGALAAYEQATQEKAPRLITFDMGGTSTDVALIDGSLEQTNQGSIGGRPIALAMLNIHTLGAGGGSLAYVDGGGALQVGPESAGSDPGPACYGKGAAVTVTDVHVYLKRIIPECFLGGRFEIFPDQSKAALKRLCKDCGLSIAALPQAILKLVNAKMVRAIRKISVERGYDPKQFTLVSFGGAAGLHACEVAEALGIKTIFIPAHPGVLSAYGCVHADIQRDFSITILKSLEELKSVEVHKSLARLKDQALSFFKKDGLSLRSAKLQYRVDMRVKGQSFEVAIPFVKHKERLMAHFNERYEQRYGVAPFSADLELVTLRLLVTFPRKLSFGNKAKMGSSEIRKEAVSAYGGLGLVHRGLLQAGNNFVGPAIISEDYATAYLPRAWKAQVDDYKNLWLSKQ